MRRPGGMVASGLSCMVGLGLVALAAARDDGGTPERVEIPRTENTFRLSPRIYSGGDPNGVEAFAALKALGVRTIVSVDGAMPDVETARSMGFRYVHLPIGYDGVPREQAVKLVKALKTLPGPVYVHCHHGKHRGPAAVAVCGIALEGWSAENAVAWLKQAGTSADYPGLYASAREFVPPTAEELAAAGAEFPERAIPPALVERMVQVDHGLDRLKAIEAAGFAAPADQPDLDPPHEARQMVESFRELARQDEAKEQGREFLEAAGSAELRATDLESALRTLVEGTSPESTAAAESALRGLEQSCTACHTRYRNR